MRIPPEVTGIAEAGGDSELYALLALGYAAEAPAAGPRRALSETAEWRTE